jgi:diguanylate cyclase (GGDEF)-like protein/PAS domain S-box-containing protein
LAELKRHRWYHFIQALSPKDWMNPKTISWRRLRSEEEYRSEVIRLLFVVSARSSLATSAILAILLALTLWKTGDHTRISFWLILMSTGLLIRAGMSIAYVRQPQPDTGKWLNRFRAGVAMTGITWGLAGLWLFPSGDIESQIVLLFILAGLTAGGTIAYSFDLPSMAAFTLPPVLLLSLRLILESFRHSGWMAAMIMLFLVFIVLNTRQVSSAFRENVRLRLDAVNTKLREKNRQQVMELLVQGAPLPTILDTLLRGVEAENPDMLCSIMLLNDGGTRLLHGAAPSLPTFYNEAIHGTPIGPDVGSCGTAAYTRKRIVVDDIATHPYWANYRELAAKAGLASCWSEPIVDTSGKTLGTFAIYHSEPTSPSQDELGLIQSISSLAAIAISRKKAEEKLQTSESNLAAAQHIAKIGSWEWDLGTDAVQFSSETYRIFGLSEDILENKGEHFFNLVHPDDRERVREAMRNALRGTAEFDVEYLIVLEDGSQKELHAIAQVERDASGRVELMRGTVHDVTERKHYERQLEHTAHHDPLTGIPNRALLADRMSQALARAKRDNELLVVCYLDLDEFKPINDTLGHDAGDKVLIEVARRIKKKVRAGDTVARLGGDEFVVLLSGLKAPEECAITLGRLLNTIALPIEINRKQVAISASIGVAIYPTDNADADVLLRHADQAMLIAKQSGRNRYHLYDVENDQRTRLHHALLSQISEGLSIGQFELLYQPKVEMRSGKMIGAEALIRWNHPQRGLLPPSEFLRAIENTELDIALGDWVIGHALAQLDAWHKEGFDIEVSINISVAHLLSGHFLEKLRHKVQQVPELAPNRLQIEVLETAALDDVPRATEVIRGCRKIGTGFALDDFGTGYSSLTYLSKLPVDTLKIDQSFVHGMMEETSDKAIVHGIISLAKGFGLRTVAEGIETKAQYQTLLEAGCEAAQGFAIARPLHAHELPAWQLPDALRLIH